jgi:hypothetical protein
MATAIPPATLEVANGRKAKVEAFIELSKQMDELQAKLDKAKAAVLEIAAPAHIDECRKRGIFVPSVLIKNAKGDEMALVTFSQATTEVTATLDAVGEALGNHQKATGFFSLETKWSLQSGLTEAHIMAIKKKLGDEDFKRTFKSKTLLTPKEDFITSFLVKGEYATEIDVLQRAGLLGFKAASVKVK